MANLQLARNLKILREKNNLTQIDVSRMLNISRQAYSNYERAVREPDLTTLIYFAEFYHVTLDELVLGNLDGISVHEIPPVYIESRNSSSKSTLFITQEEVSLIMNYRNRTKDDQRIIKRFLDMEK